MCSLVQETEYDISYVQFSVPRCFAHKKAGSFKVREVAQACLLTVKQTVHMLCPCRIGGTWGHIV
jgi:hypothetical protein